MAQQYVSIFAIAYRGHGVRVCKHPESLLDLVPRRQSDHPWLLHYARWFDPWLMGDSYRFPAQASGVALAPLGEHGYREVLRLVPNADRRAALRASLRRKFQFPEQEQYNRQLLRACVAYDDLFADRRIFVIRDVVAASLGDDEVKALIENG